MSDMSTVSAMFEEIKQLLKKINNRTSEQESAQHTNVDGLDKAGMTELQEAINRCGEKIVSGMEDLKQSFSTEKCKVDHRIFIDIKSSWVFLTMTGLVMLLIIALSFSYKQWQQNGKLKNNDLKYRYVLMKSGLTADQLKWLEESFPNNKGSIQAKVLEYETLVQKQGKAIIQQQLDEQATKELDEKIKGLEK